MVNYATKIMPIVQFAVRFWLYLCCSLFVSRCNAGHEIIKRVPRQRKRALTGDFLFIQKRRIVKKNPFLKFFSKEFPEKKCSCVAKSLNSLNVIALGCYTFVFKSVAK